MKKNVQLSFLAIAASLLMIGCSDDNVEYMMPQTSRIQLDVEKQEVVNQTNDFAFNLFRAAQEAKGQDNVCISPVSVVFNLGMINDGATGETQKEITTALGTPSADAAQLNNICNTLITGLPKVDPAVDFVSANALFSNSNIAKLKDAYVADLQKYYQAEVGSYDFSSSDFAKTANSWVRDKTHGMIASMPVEIDPNAVCYLLSSVYFKAMWTDKFDQKNTKDETFTTEDGTKVTLPMMHNKANIVCKWKDDFTMLCLPYGSGSKWNMYILLPNKGVGVANVARQLNSATWKDLAHMDLNEVKENKSELDIKIPRFTAADNSDLARLLPNLGIKRVFNPSAELPGISEDQLFVNKMNQSAKMEVNEEGTKAVAVTSSDLENFSEEISIPAVRKDEFYADHPFLYLITENSSNTIVFIGSYFGK